MTEVLKEMKDTIKEARKKAAYSFYDESLGLYLHIVQELGKHILNVKEPALKTDWQKLIDMMESERAMVQEAKNPLSSVGKKKNSVALQPEPKRAKECPEFDGAKEQRYPFGKKPFQRDLDEYPRRPAQNFQSMHNNGSGMNGMGPGAYGMMPGMGMGMFGMMPGSGMGMYPPQQAKDPDVWEPPPPRKQDKKKSQQPKRGGPANNSSGTYGNKREYQKPWAVKKQKQDGKKSYLHSVYPDGHGPDSDLIAMIEREIMNTNPGVKFEDIAELELAKNALQEAVILPLKMPSFFVGIKKPWQGVLMFGPPGTGKTMLAKAVASLGGTTFFSVSASSLASKWKGQSEKLMRILFEMARFYAPSTIFFDEIDAIISKRGDKEHDSDRKVKTQLLIEMEGAKSVAPVMKDGKEELKTVTVIAATNRPWDLDEAMRRRLEKRIYIPLPSQNGRAALFKIYLRDLEVGPDVEIDDLVKQTDGYSGHDIMNICKEAAHMPLRRRIDEQGGYQNITDYEKLKEEVNRPLNRDDFIVALKRTNKSVGTADLAKYEVFKKEFGCN